MRLFQPSRLLHLILTLWLSTADLYAQHCRRHCPPEHRSPLWLQWKDSPLGKQQKYYFDLIDVAAVFKLPWSWPVGESPWRLETRLITSAGVLQGAGENGLMATLVPDLALSGWGGLVTFDAGAGAGFFSNYKFGMQDFGGPVQIVATVGSSRQSIFSRLCRISCPTLLRCGRVRIGQSRGGHVHHRDRIPILTPAAAGWFPLQRTNGLPPYDFHPDNTQRCAINGVKLSTSSETLVMTSSASP